VLRIRYKSNCEDYRKWLFELADQEIFTLPKFPLEMEGELLLLTRNRPLKTNLRLQ